MISQVEYNGYTFTASQATLEEFAGAGLPDIRASEENKSQQDGSVATGYRYGGRTFGWSGRLSADTFALYLAERRELMEALSMQNYTDIAGYEMTFTLLDDSELTLRAVRVINAVFDFPGDEPSIEWNSYQVTFRAAFPFLEGTETTGTQQVTSSAFGVVVPAPVPAPLTSTSSATSSTDPLTLTNAGNANAYPVYTITGPGTTFTISNSTTGHSMVISETLAAGENIIIDTWAKTVTKGGVNILSTMSGAWIYLQPGANTLTLTVASASDSNTELQTVYKDTYLNI